MTRWAAHALILTRDAESIHEQDVATAAELFFLNLDSAAAGLYPFLETFNISPRQRALAIAR